METMFGADPFQKRDLPNAPEADEANWALYDQFLDICESHRWKMSEVRKEIEAVDPAKLTEKDLRVVDCVGEVAVVEGNAPSIIVNQLAIMLYDAEFSAWATYQVGEEAKHFHVIRHYCRHVGHPIAQQHAERRLCDVQKGFDPNDFQDEYAVILINAFGETLNVHLYQTLAAEADEPVLQGILQRLARDERRHQQWFLAYFKKRAAADPQYIPKALDSLRHMLRLHEAPVRRAQQHQGSGASNYLTATKKVLEYGYATRVIVRTVEEQWEVLTKLFGDALDIDKREFRFRQMAKPR